jgi:hypothetical protein
VPGPAHRDGARRGASPAFGPMVTLARNAMVRSAASLRRRLHSSAALRGERHRRTFGGEVGGRRPPAFGLGDGAGRARPPGSHGGAARFCARRAGCRAHADRRSAGSGLRAHRGHRHRAAAPDRLRLVIGARTRRTSDRATRLDRGRRHRRGGGARTRRWFTTGVRSGGGSTRGGHAHGRAREGAGDRHRRCHRGRHWTCDRSHDRRSGRRRDRCLNGRRR